MNDWDNTVMFWHNEQWWAMLGVTCFALLATYLFCKVRNC